MTINLFNNSSQANVINKDISQLMSLQGNLKYSSSLLKPVVTIESQSVITANYAQIVEFNRYYYINDIISEHNNIWTISMSVDVLMSFADEIKAQTAIVARQSGRFNMYLDDGWFMCYQNPIISTKLFSVSNPFETQTFVLVVAGNTGTGNSE